MSSLKPKHIDSDEQNEDIVEYIQITEKERIKALRKTEKKRSNLINNPQHYQSDVKEETNKSNPRNDSKKMIKSKDIKQQKEKIALTKKDNSKHHEGRNEENQSHNNQQKKSKYRQKFSKDERKEDSQHKSKYVQKPKNDVEDKIYYQNQRKYSAEVAQQQPKKIYRQIPKNRNQNTNIKGENVDVRMQDIEDEYDNEIYVNKKSVEHYVDLAKDLINRYEFIALKAFGNKIQKAILIAGFLSEEFSQLKQINIPRIINVSQTTKQGSSSKKRAGLTIELSLKKLNKRHMGYQQSDAQPKVQHHNDKPQTRYIEKRSVEYSEKPRYMEKSNKFNEQPINFTQKSYKEKPASNNRANNNRFKEKEVDQRDLR